MDVARWVIDSGARSNFFGAYRDRTGDLRLAKNLLEHEERPTAEALLHARTRRGTEPKPAWTEPFRGRRWREVRKAILAFEGEGIATTFDNINLIADHAYMEGTGATFDEVMERFYYPMWEAEASAAGY